MAHVLVLDSVNEDIFVCGLCKSVFNSIDIFLDHKRTCNLQMQYATTTRPDNALGVVSEKPVNAPEFVDIKTLHVVKKEVTSMPNTAVETAKDTSLVEQKPCPECGKYFKKKKSLIAHLKSHYSKPFQCMVCGRCFMQNSHLQRHVFSHRVWPESLSKTTAKSKDAELLSYSCPYCQMVFSNYNQFRSHLKNHQSFKKYKCIQNVCSSFHDSVEDLLYHVTLEHPSPVYICYICNVSFGSLDLIAKHQLTHKEFKSDNKLFKCSLCDATFKKLDKLSLHMHTENHKKVCIHCNRVFASDKRLRLHLQIHIPKKDFQCDVCNKSFQLKKYLVTHMLRHGPRDYKCRICQCMFKRSDVLQRHMKSHQVIKMFQCPYTDICDREFNRKDKYKLHLQTHLKKKREETEHSGNEN